MSGYSTLCVLAHFYILIHVLYMKRQHGCAALVTKCHRSNAAYPLQSLDGFKSIHLEKVKFFSHKPTFPFCRRALDRDQTAIN